MAGSPLAGLAGALISALEPLRRAMTSVDGLLFLLRELGWKPELDDLIDQLFEGPGGGPGPFAQFAALAGDIVSAVEAAEAVVARVAAGEDVEAGEIVALFEDFRAIVAQVQGIRDLASQPGALPGCLQIEGLWQSVRDDLPDYLLCRYLSVHQARLYELLAILGVATEVRVVPDPDAPFRIPFRRREVRWDYLGDLLADPLTHLREVYRWGGAKKPDDPQELFDAARLMVVLARLLAGLGLDARAGPLSDVLSETYLGRPVPPPRFRPPQLTVPLLRRQAGPAGAYFALELGAIPPGPVAFARPLDAAPVPVPPADSLVFTHLSRGTLADTVPLSETIDLTLSGSVDASHQLNVLMRPSGLELNVSPGASYEIALGVAGDAPADPGHWHLFGDPAGTRLTLAGLSGGLTLSGTTAGVPGLGAEFGLRGLTFTLAAGEGDGLFNTLLGALELTAGADIDIRYAPATGVTFNATGGMQVVVPLDVTLGPVHLDEIELSLAPEDGGLRLEALIGGSLDIGPLYAAVERVGLYVAATPAGEGDGMVGPFDIGAGFVPPSGYAVSLDADPISGGGYVSVADNEYRGALALNFGKIGFSAHAILTTEFPDGSEGYSFAASIFAEFSVPLAYGFFLTGLGGFIGINRALDTDAMRGVLFDGRLDGLLFPADPIAAAPQILDDMAAILPPMPGRHVIGPCARISWGQPRLIDITLGVMIELGGDGVVVILGGLSMILPDKDKVLVSLRVQFMGEINFAAGTISFDATLEGSRVLTYAIDGDIAIRTGWGAAIEHIASFGGLHPQYPKPANLPDLARLSITFGGNNPRVTLSSYFALTPNSLQFGARADLYAKGPKITFVGQVAAEGYVAFDALIYFNPFSFQVGLRGGLSLLVDGKVKAGLFFALELAGPNTYHISGEVWVKVLGVKVRFGITHRWGQRENLPTYSANAADLLVAAISGVRAFEPVSDGSRDTAVAFRGGPDTEGTVDPLGGLRLTQTTAPLGIRLERVGESNITGPRVLDLSVSLDGQAVAAAPVTGSFVRGHFFAISKAERLRAPVLESHKAGVDIGGGGLVAGGEAVVESYAYEVIVIGMHGSDAGWSAPGIAAVLSGVRAEGFVRAGQLGRLMPAAGRGAVLQPVETLRLAETGFVAVAGGGAAATLSEARMARGGAPVVAVASYIGDAA